MNRFLKLLLPTGVLVSLLAGGIFVTHLVKAADAYIVNGGAYNTMEEALIATLPSERATVKGEQIAKIKTITKVQRSDYWIEVVDTKPRENGVEVFAKAWDKNGNQIGFGSDGMVEIERFVVINPPILVPDPNGTVVRESKSPTTGQVVQRTYREDLQEALLQSLEHTLSVKKQKYGPAYIIPGKVGNTTLTAYPLAGSGTAPVDGVTARKNVDETFATIQAGAGTFSRTTLSDEVTALYSSGTSNQFNDLRRGGFGFDTSSIGSDTIDSATLSLYGMGSGNGLGGSPTVGVVSFSPADPTVFATSDFAAANWGTTVYASMAISAITGSVYNDRTLDANGRAYINKNGNTYFGERLSWDIDNSFGGTWAANVETSADWAHADTAGTTQDPKLVVEHSQAAPVLSNLAYSNVTASGAKITWTTDVSADSQVTYDTSSPVTVGDPSVYDATASTTHSVSLSSLSAATTYYFFASSTAGGLSATSTESSFTTSALSFNNLRATNIGSGWGDIKWETDTAADSKVWYSLTSPVSATNFTEVYDATATTTHSLYLSGLLHNAVYYYLAVSTTGGGSTATSSEKTFNTTSTALCSD